MGKKAYKRNVLILIVLEHALGGPQSFQAELTRDVLILIVLEHALGVLAEQCMVVIGLNPYCIGTCSRSVQQSLKSKKL